MLANLREKLKKTNNEGSSLVMVIITIAFLSALVSMMIYMVYYNYLMKYTDRASKNNFYTAESALDEIKAGVQELVSEAMIEAYYEVITTYADETASNQQSMFETIYQEKIKEVFGYGSVDANGSFVYYYDVAMLEDFWQETPKASDSAAGVGATLLTIPYSSSNWNLADTTVKSNFLSEGPNWKQSNGVSYLQNVSISYVDESGYVSIITTDIAIETPELSFSTTTSLPDIQSYCLVAGGGIYNGYTIYDNEIYATNDGTTTTITGNVYGGTSGIFASGTTSVIKLGTDAGDSYTVTAAKISALNSKSSATSIGATTVNISSDYQVWAADLYVESATMDIAADCFIQDDLTIDGTYSKIILSGNYYGYGSAYQNSTSNSGILINGAHTTLDFSSLKTLQLAGHAYVGSIHYDAAAGDSTIGSDYIEDLSSYTSSSSYINTSDVLMGQSVAIKSDQIMYMVPSECMGYEGNTQILAKNPMTYDEYVKFATTYEPEYDSNGNIQYDANGDIIYSSTLKYTAVRLDVVMDKVGGSANSYGASYTPVFRRVNNSILVYFYLCFKSDDQANKFFYDYYTADPDSFTQYYSSYVDSFTINSSVISNSNSQLSIAGHMLYGSGSSISLIEDTTDEDLSNYAALEESRNTWADFYAGLSSYLMKTTDDLSASQLKQNAYENIVVDSSTFASLIGNNSVKEFVDASGTVVALGVNKSSVFELTSEYADVALIICSGDIKVSIPSFEGLILCGGDIILGASNSTITYNAAKVQSAMTATSANGDYAYSMINNGVAYASAVSTTDTASAAAKQKDADTVRSSDLVNFVNWTKE